MSVSFFLTLCGNAAVGLAFISDKRFISTKAVWAFSAHTIFGTAWKVLVYIVMIYSVDMIHFWQRIAWLMASTSISSDSARSLARPSLTIWIRFYGKINKESWSIHSPPYIPIYAFSSILFAPAAAENANAFVPQFVVVKIGMHFRFLVDAIS